MMLMNNYLNVDDLWCDTLRHMFEHGKLLGSRAGPCLETLGFTATLSNVNSTFLMNDRRNLSPHYACAELMWYLGSNANIGMITAYAPQYVNFAEDGVAFGAYGHRMFSNLWGRDGQAHTATCDMSQLDLVVQHLREDHNTRQAVITLWEANDLVHAIRKDHKDLPCTLALQLFIRDDRLHMIATMRSNDAWLGLPYDVFAFTGIQQIVGFALGIECGTYTHQAGSEHLYQKNWKAAEEAIATGALTPARLRMQHGWNCSPCMLWHDAIIVAHAVERLARTGQVELTNRAYEQLCYLMSNPYNVLHDITACCVNKWRPTILPRSPILSACLIDKKKDTPCS